MQTAQNTNRMSFSDFLEKAEKLRNWFIIIYCSLLTFRPLAGTFWRRWGRHVCPLVSSHHPTIASSRERCRFEQFEHFRIPSPLPCRSPDFASTKLIHGSRTTLEERLNWWLIEKPESGYRLWKSTEVCRSSRVSLCAPILQFYPTHL